MTMRIHKAGDDGLACGVHDGCALRHLHLRARSGSRDAIAADENDGVVHGGGTGAVNQPGTHDRRHWSRCSALRLRSGSKC